MVAVWIAILADDEADVVTWADVGVAELFRGEGFVEYASLERVQLLYLVNSLLKLIAQKLFTLVQALDSGCYYLLGVCWLIVIKCLNYRLTS